MNVQTELQKRIVAVFNIGSGSCDAECANVARAVFDQAGLAHAEVVAIEPGDVDRALDAAVARADVVVVLGGDGTIAAAASRCSDAGSLLIPLPGGTMNMLPTALYGMRPWRDALAATLADPAIRHVSGGKAGDHPFYCAAIFGAPSLWAQAREAAREGEVVETIKRAITATRRSLHESLDYDLGAGLAGSARAVVAICPVISRELDQDEPALEVAAVDADTATALFGLGFSAAFADWRQHASVRLAKVTQFSVSGHGEVPAILDGETVRFGRGVTIRFEPVAFRALVPAERRSGQA